MAIKKNIQITVQAIDVDGDGIPDGDLVSKWLVKPDGTRKLVSHKFVSAKDMQNVAHTAASAANSKGKKLVTYKGATPPASQEQQPVQVQDKTTFGQYIKLGAGVEVGRIAVDSVANALSDLF
jgi:hypothetical protein